MTSHRPPKLAAALLRHLTAADDSLAGDLDEAFQHDKLHRTSLVILYVASVALVSPYWMSADTDSMTAANRVFWILARILGGYGVVGVLLVPFLILLLGRSGPPSAPPIRIR